MKKGLSPLYLSSGIENRSTASPAVKSTDVTCVAIPLQRPGDSSIAVTQSVSSAAGSEPGTAPTAAEDPGRAITQGHISSPLADLFKIVYGNIFKLLEEIYICKIENEK